MASEPATLKPVPAAWPADKVERWPLERLRPYAKNARTHSPEQVAQIAASMREWGWTNPVLVDESGELIAGHGRIPADPHYDAKAWDVCAAAYGPGRVLFWNVTGPARP